MTTDTIKQLGAEFHHAADGVGEALQRLDNARLDRLTFLRRCSKDSTARLAAIKEELRTLPEQIAKWDAEAARLESHTAEDLLWQALGAVVLHPQLPGEVIEAPLTQPAPEPYRAGLPPERLRKVWAEWEDQEGHVVTFKDDLYHWTHWPPNTPIKRIMDVAWIGMKLRPLGNTHAYVEAMADEKERALPRPVENCGHVAADGTCGHPNALTPECHDGVVCPVKAERPVATPQPKGKRAVVMVGDLPYYADSVAFDTKGKLIKGEGVPFGLPPTPPAPTLLDLTKLPPGTVCEATGQIARGSHVILPGERFAFAGSPTELLARVRVFGRDESFDVPTVVYARVVEVPR